MHDGTQALVVWGLLSHELAEVVEFYASPEAAEGARERLVSDEPGWVGDLEVVRVEFGEAVEVTRTGASTRNAA